MIHNVFPVRIYITVKDLPRPIDYSHARMRAKRHPPDNVINKTKTLRGCQYPDDHFFFIDYRNANGGCQRFVPDDQLEYFGNVWFPMGTDSLIPVAAGKVFADCFRKHREICPENAALIRYEGQVYFSILFEVGQVPVNARHILMLHGID